MLNKGKKFRKKFIGTINQDWIAMKGSGGGKPVIQRMTPYRWINRSNKRLTWKADEEQNWYDVKEKNIKVKWKKVSY